MATASADRNYPRLQLKTVLELPPIQWEVYLFFVPAAVADVAIAITLSLLFRRSRTGIQKCVISKKRFRCNAFAWSDMH
jgi:hypothetical protein